MPDRFTYHPHCEDCALHAYIGQECHIVQSIYGSNMVTIEFDDGHRVKIYDSELTSAG